MHVFVDVAMHECVLRNQRAHRPLFQHQRASHRCRTKADGKLPERKTGGGDVERQQKAAGCVSFPALLKSDRVRDREIFTD